MPLKQLLLKTISPISFFLLKNPQYILLANETDYKLASSFLDSWTNYPPLHSHDSPEQPVLTYFL